MGGRCSDAGGAESCGVPGGEAPSESISIIVIIIRAGNNVVIVIALHLCGCRFYQETTGNIPNVTSRDVINQKNQQTISQAIVIVAPCLWKEG